MQGRPTWSGGIELAGLNIYVRLYSMSTSVPGFKMLDPDLQRPVKQKLVNEQGLEVERAETLKGVELGGDKYAVLDPAAVDAIGRLSKTDVTVPVQFAPLDSVPFTLAQATYAVVPDPKVAGSEGPVNILWNGLRANGWAYMTALTIRAGSPDRIAAIWADDKGLYVSTLPYQEDVKNGDYAFSVDQKQADTFKAFVEHNYELAEFDHGQYVSQHKALRAEAIEAAVAGKPVELPEPEAKPTAGQPDLMAALEASLGEAKAAVKAPSKKRAAAKKPAAKKTTKKAVKA